MEFLETSRSAKKYDPQRTARYRRADPRATNIVLGYQPVKWETTNKDVQRRTTEGSLGLGKSVMKDRTASTARKRGILSSSISFGNEFTDYRTESKNYVTHDLKTWGPRTSLQLDSYSWTDREKSKLKSLRVHGNPVSGNSVKFDPYTKLPPISSESQMEATQSYGTLGNHVLQNGSIPQQTPNAQRHDFRSGRYRYSP